MQDSGLDQKGEGNRSSGGLRIKQSGDLGLSLHFDQYGKTNIEDRDG